MEDGVEDDVEPAAAHPQHQDRPDVDGNRRRLVVPAHHALVGHHKDREAVEEDEEQGAEQPGHAGAVPRNSEHDLRDERERDVGCEGADLHVANPRVAAGEQRGEDDERRRERSGRDRLDHLCRERQRLGAAAALHRARERRERHQQREDHEQEIPRVDIENRARAVLLLLASRRHRVRHARDDGIAGTGRRAQVATYPFAVTTITVLRGDQTGQELLDESLRVIAPDVIGVDLDLLEFDLSLANRRETRNGVVGDAADAMRECGFGLKAATVTPTARGDVGSPNALLRERVGGRVILRTGQRLPGVAGIAGVSAPISIVRMAVDDAYNAEEWREEGDDDEIAFRTEHISRSTCRAVAEFAFVHAARTQARVFGGPKFTVSRVYEGMFKEELDAAAGRHPDVDYEPQLIDATYALLFSRAGDALVIPALNRDGDCLSDLVLPLFGSIAGAESLLLGFDHDPLVPKVVMAEAPHGTAPSLEGKNVANPMAMILAASALLGFAREPGCVRASGAIRHALFEVLRAGIATSDLGGNASMSEFTDAVITRTRSAIAAA